jgi:hypothetical protein
MLGKAGFQVGSLILVDDQPFGILVDQTKNFRKFFLGFLLVGQCPEIPYGIPHGLGNVAVLGFSGFSLSDPFQR